MAEAYKPVDAFDSMTESTFILRPSSQQQQPQQDKPKTKSKRGRPTRVTAGKSNNDDDDNNENISANGGYVQLIQARESADSMQLRQRLFEDMWVPLEQLLVEIEQQVNNVGVTEVCSFIDSSYKRIESREEGQLEAPFAEIAAAVAFSGVNTGDHSKLFQSLQNQLVSRGHHVALLESQYCSSLPNMLKALLDQVSASLGVSDSTGPRGKSSSAVFGVGSSAKTIPYDMSLLKLWWDMSKTSKDSRAVIILQDFEGFAPMIVDDFVRIAARYCQEVPIVVVLGLATSYESIHQSLTKASISMLNVERFNLQRSKQCIDAVIRSIFVEGASTLLFGAESYKSLIDQFLMYNFSITGFVNKLKYAVMNFFYAQPLSVLAAMLKHSGGGANGRTTVVECPIRLSEDQVELIRMQKSVQEFLEDKADGPDGRKYVHHALTDDEFFQNTALPEMVQLLVSYRQCYRLGMEMILAVQGAMPKSLHKPIHMLHYYGISQLFDECVHWKTLSAVMRRMKAPEMEQLLANLCLVVEAAGSIDFAHAIQNGVDIPFLLQEATDLISDPEAALTEQNETSEALSKRIRTRTDMENRPFLLFDDSSSDQMLRALDKCSGHIEAILRVCLLPYQRAPLQEIFYYKQSLLLDTTFSAQPRAAVQAALGKSHYYINCDCCRSAAEDLDDSNDDDDDGEDNVDAEQRLMASMNDTSIAYRLHQECGRMINLYDWYSAFASVVEQGGGQARKQVAQSEIQARFMRAVEEMRFLGFIKSTQRKTDHVMRLTWAM
ncbi:Origin recognition complex subunit 3 [Kickxella alabastrina]|uniref:Origin recognition complex subunit 3 n=1 Tax=Kickxella alabastrina TaxID=61397 RepID=A0ACC1IM59_9FUNG|nr:Origin recognition complex subunit 3 [Kickxella alabastrina]